MRVFLVVFGGFSNIIFYQFPIHVNNIFPKKEKKTKTKTDKPARENEFLFSVL